MTREAPNWPDRWGTATGQDAFELVTSGSRGWAEHYADEGAKFIRIGNLDHDSIALDLKSIQHVKPPVGAEGQRTRLRADDLLISITAELGMVGLVPPDLGEAYINQHIALARPRAGWESRFLAWYFASEADGKRALKASGRGGTKAGLGLDDIRNAPVPAAPWQEQRRIADKLDTVLARVDAVNDRLARVAPLLKRFRQSVLAAAASGKLTEEWRRDRGGNVGEKPFKLGASMLPIPSTWQSTVLNEVIDSSRPLCYGVVQPGAEVEVEGAVPLIRVQDMERATIAVSSLRTIGLGVDQEFRRSRVQSGDVLVSVVGTIGRIAIVPEGFAGNIARAVARVACSQAVNSQWVRCWLEAPDVQWWLLSSSKEVARKTLNLGDLAELPLPLPMLDEQSEIVRRVELLFAYADRLEARLQAAQTAAQRLTPSLLAKAFRGELVPQDPKDEPAAELLKRLASARESQAVKPAKRGRAAAKT